MFAFFVVVVNILKCVPCETNFSQENAPAYLIISNTEARRLQPRKTFRVKRIKSRLMLFITALTGSMWFYERVHYNSLRWQITLKSSDTTLFTRHLSIRLP